MTSRARGANGAVHVPTGGDRRIRVLWLIKGLGRGGAEQLLQHAAEIRDRERFEYEVAYLLRDRSAVAEELRAFGVPTHVLDASSEVDLGWMLRLRRLLHDRRFDVVHSHSPYVAGVARLIVRSLPRRMRPLTISTEHVPWSGYALPTRILNAATFALDAEHIAVSDAVRASIARPFNHRIHTVIHGVPLEAIRQHAAERDVWRRRVGVSEDQILIGTVANFRAQKGYPDLLQAAAMVLSRAPNVRFAAAGQGPLEAQIRELHARLGLGAGFQLLGAVPKTGPFLAACDIFALASHYEGLPLAVMEAMALGVPVVATGVDGVVELVRDGADGVLVPRSQPARLAEALLALASDHERRAAMGREAAAGAKRFDNRPAVETIEDMYVHVTSNRRWS
jgi:glycosyltransferase involved in cell wall biosynthesis